MPRVTLSGYECANDLLPPVCAECGAPADQRVPFRADWTPFWGSFVPGVNFLMTRRLTLRLPLCRRHAWRRRWGSALTMAAFLPTFALGGAALVNELDQPPGVADERATVRFAWSAAALLPLSILVAAVVLPGVSVKRITDRHLILDGLHESFVTALAEDRAKNADPLRANGYGDARDDFDDKPGQGA